MFTLADIEAALPIVRTAVPATPQYAWPLLKAATGVEVVVKHENHTPIGAFKVRGGLVYVDRLKQARPDIAGIVSATTGNHGQSLAFAGQRLGLKVTIVAPFGNSPEKNAAMRAFGAELIERGRAFAPSYHRDLVIGVATYAYELLTACADLDVAYVPIGLGSGISGMIGMRDALGLKTAIVGVVAERANAYRLSLEAGRVVPTNSALTFAEGVAVRVPDAQALDIIRGGAERIVEVSEDEIAEAIRVMFGATHSLPEGAGAVALAALMKERAALKGKRAAVILSGQNFDRTMAQTVLNGNTPRIA